MTSRIMLSVAICSHNPRLDYLTKVLAALQQQTLAYDLWELILIDNASDILLKSQIDLSWHPNGSHIREEQLGLTFARLRSIQEVKSDIIVFVDDDNVLDSYYLEYVVQISNGFPFLGAWGGQTIPKFEELPPEWTKPLWSMLAIWEFEKDTLSNLVYQYTTTPCGAGLCILNEVDD